MVAVAKSYMRKGFLIYEEMRKYQSYTRRPLAIYALQPFPSGFPYIRGKFFLLFYQCTVYIHQSLLKGEIVVGIKLSLPPSPILSSAGIFKQSMGAIGTKQEQGYRTGPPSYIGWRLLFLGIDSWAPKKVKNSGSAAFHACWNHALEVFSYKR